MLRMILTGAPGAGKTSLLRLIERRGHRVVEEAATDVIALAQARGLDEPWTDPSFAEEIALLQKQRQLQADAMPADVIVFDRSPVCTLALCEFLSHAPGPELISEIERIERDRIYDRQVLFTELLGVWRPTPARRIGLEDSRRFEAVHRDVYRRLGYSILSLPPDSVDARFAAIEHLLGGRPRR